MNYFEARWYDPALGRWHSPDPLEQFHSPYVGMANDPANFVDPDGRNAREWIKSHSWDLENLGKTLLVIGGGLAMPYIGQFSAICGTALNGLAMGKTAKDIADNKKQANAHSFDPSSELMAHCGVGMSYRGASNEQEQSFDDEEAQEGKGSDSPNDGFENCTPPNAYDITICDGKVVSVVPRSNLGEDEIDYFYINDISNGPRLNARTLQVVSVKHVTIQGGEVLDMNFLTPKGNSNVSPIGVNGRYPGVKETVVHCSPALQECFNPIELFVGVGVISFSRNLVKVGAVKGGEQLLLGASKFARLDFKYAKHAADWSQWGSISKTAYYNRAVRLAESQVGGKIMGFTSKQGWSFRFNSSTGEFLTIHPSGYIETFFRPTGGMDYYLKQVQLYGH